MLYQLSYIPISQQRGSNPQPADYKSAALPVELCWRTEADGFEPSHGINRLPVFKTDPFSHTWVYLHSLCRLKNNIQHADIALHPVDQQFIGPIHVPVYSSDGHCYSFVRSYATLTSAISYGTWSSQVWCRRRDLNPQPIGRRILNPLCKRFHHADTESIIDSALLIKKIN